MPFFVREAPKTRVQRFKCREHSGLCVSELDKIASRIMPYHSLRNIFLAGTFRFKWNLLLFIAAKSIFLNTPACWVFFTGGSKVSGQKMDMTRLGFDF